MRKQACQLHERYHVPASWWVRNGVNTETAVKSMPALSSASSSDKTAEKHLLKIFPLFTAFKTTQSSEVSKGAVQSGSGFNSNWYFFRIIFSISGRMKLKTCFQHGQ